MDCDDLAADERPAVLQLVSARTQEHGFLWLHYTVVRDRTSVAQPRSKD